MPHVACSGTTHDSPDTVVGAIGLLNLALGLGHLVRSVDKTTAQNEVSHFVQSVISYDYPREPLTTLRALKSDRSLSIAQLGSRTGYVRHFE